MATIIKLAQTDPKKAKQRINQMRRRSFFEGYIEGAVSMLSPNDIVVEMGAGSGDLTEKFALNGTKVYAFESRMNLVSELRDRIAAWDNVHLEVTPPDYTHARMRLESLLQENVRIAILCLDMQGAELDFLESLQEGQGFDNIGLTFVRCHPQEISKHPKRYNELSRQAGLHPEWNLIVEKT